MKELIKKLIYFIFSPFFKRKGKDNAIYITFDDGPHPEKTEKILMSLKKEKVKATFFMIGQEMEKHIETVKKVIDEGHSVGYHSYSHDSLKNTSLLQAIKDLKRSKQLARKLNIKINLYRPPYGDLTPLSFLYLAITGWKIIMWSLDSRDSFDTAEQVIKTTSPDNISPGEILLFHDDYELTARVLPGILQKIKKAGLDCKVF